MVTHFCAKYAIVGYEDTTVFVFKGQTENKVNKNHTDKLEILDQRCLRISVFKCEFYREDK